jgi:hypothetical protein
MMEGKREGWMDRVEDQLTDIHYSSPRTEEEPDGLWRRDGMRATFRLG